jgi:hypothetical protein
VARSGSFRTLVRHRAVGLVLVGGVVTLGVGATVADASVEPTPSPAPGPATSSLDHPAVILVAVTGLEWNDVRTLSTPALWELSRQGSVGTVAARSVRPTSCPADGWLAVSAGVRAADAQVPEDTCRTLAEPTLDVPLPGWADYTESVASQPYAARLGLFGDTLAAAGVPVTGIGPGAAIATADGDGYPVGTYLRRAAAPAELEQAVRDALLVSDLVVVDAGSVRDPGFATARRPGGQPEVEEAEEAEPEDILPDDEPGEPSPTDVEVIVEPTRAEQVRVVDQRIDAVIRASARSGATVLVVSLADSGRAGLQLAIAEGPAPGGAVYGQSLLGAGSTRQPGLVLTTDVTSTVLAILGLDPLPGTTGAQIVPVDGPATATARMQRLYDITQEARQVTRVSSPYLTYLVLGQALLFIAAAIVLTRARRMRPALRILRVAGLALGAATIASFLVGLLPWWRAGTPSVGFWLSLLGWTVAITALALAGPWRHSLFGPAGVVAGVTAAVLVVDALTGSMLVIDAPMGAHRLMAARFYGMSNQAFAMVAAASLLLAMAVAQPLVDRGLRRRAVAAVAVIGVVVTLVNGAPGLGSDFGGPPGLILGFTVLGLAVAGRKVRWRALLLVAGVAVVVVGGFAAVDWMRPPADRTHLGRFFATVIDGGLWEVVVRKYGVQFRVLTLWRYVVLSVGGILLTALVLVGPRPRSGAGLRGSSPLAGLRQAVPLLPAAIAAIGLALGVGVLINDSGIVIAATGIAIAVPCLVAAAAQRSLAVTDTSPDDGGPGQVV